MKNLFTLAATAALASASLGAQAQFTVDGTLGATELNSGTTFVTGKYQLVSTFTGTRSLANRGLKALYVGTTATTLNILIIASLESPGGGAAPDNGFNSMVLYLNTPNRTGIAAGTRLPGSNDNGNSGRFALRQRPTLDMEVDYGFRNTVNPLESQPGERYLSRVDYTIANPGAAGYPEQGMGRGTKDGVPTTEALDPGMVATAYKTSGTVTANANVSTGWELSIPLTTIGLAVTGANFQMMVAHLDDFGAFQSDVLPTIPAQTAALGIDPNFTTIAGNQFVTYQVGTGPLANRSAAIALQASAYPNPLAAASRLSYTVPNTVQAVSVDVYNSLGQKAMTLLDKQESAGRHEVALAPLQKLAAGPYLVTLRVGTHVSSHRVVVE